MHQEQPQETKVCKRCEESKPFDEYYTHPTNADGLQTTCKSCQSIIRKERYRKNKEKEKQQTKERRQQKIYEENIKWIKNLPHSYYEDNIRKIKGFFRDRIRKKVKSKRSWQYMKKEHPFKVIAHRNTQRAKKSGVLSTMTEQDFEDVFNYFGGCCPLTRGSEDLQTDHFIPLSKGGTNEPHNVYFVDAMLNNRKRTKNPFEFYGELIQEGEIEQRDFDKIVEYLSEQANMTPNDFENHVYSYFE